MFFNNLFGKFSQNQEVVKQQPPPALVPVVDMHVEQGIVHCCCSFSPEIFERLTSNSRLPFQVWYKALWIVQHYQAGANDVPVRLLERELGISFPTAQIVKKKILNILETYHGI